MGQIFEVEALDRKNWQPQNVFFGGFSRRLCMTAPQGRMTTLRREWEVARAKPS